MEEYDKRVTAMYNDCWKLYRDYTKSHDMRQFNEAKDAVIEKYGRQCDVIDLVLWIAIRVQTLLEKNKKYYGREKTFDQQYVHTEDSETHLVEFLKNLQKGAK